jgi:hypothetical protein
MLMRPPIFLIAFLLSLTLTILPYQMVVGAAVLPFNGSEIYLKESLQREKQALQIEYQSQRGEIEHAHAEILADNLSIHDAIKQNKIDGLPWDHLEPSLTKSELALKLSTEDLEKIRKSEVTAKNESFLYLLDAKRLRVLNKVSLLDQLEIELKDTPSEKSGVRHAIRQEIQTEIENLNQLLEELHIVHNQISSDLENRTNLNDQYPLQQEVKNQFDKVLDAISELQNHLNEQAVIETRISALKSQKLLAAQSEKLGIDNDIRVLQQQYAEAASKVSDSYRSQGAVHEAERWRSVAESYTSASENTAWRIVLTFSMAAFAFVGMIISLVLKSDFRRLEKRLTWFARFVLRNTELLELLPAMLGDILAQKASPLVTVFRILWMIVNLWLAEQKNAHLEHRRKRSAGDSIPKSRGARSETVINENEEGELDGEDEDPLL